MGQVSIDEDVEQRRCENLTPETVTIVTKMAADPIGPKILKVHKVRVQKADKARRDFVQKRLKIWREEMKRQGKSVGLIFEPVKRRNLYREYDAALKEGRHLKIT